MRIKKSFYRNASMVCKNIYIIIIFRFFLIIFEIAYNAIKAECYGQAMYYEYPFCINILANKEKIWIMWK